MQKFTHAQVTDHMIQEQRTQHSHIGTMPLLGQRITHQQSELHA